ncbi:hypothetical protein [Metabacillus sp. RGM 3146]|uniref:hypothetical protein n=1 Tax=Metabacillus sp. RGM 3146 TaxID=3401092 RepID=UPI003B9A637C
MKLHHAAQPKMVFAAFNKYKAVESMDTLLFFDKDAKKLYATSLLIENETSLFVN